MNTNNSNDDSTEQQPPKTYAYPPSYNSPVNAPPMYYMTPMASIPLNEQIILIPKKMGQFLWKFDEQVPSVYRNQGNYHENIKLCNDALQKNASRNRIVQFSTIFTGLVGIGLMIWSIFERREYLNDFRQDWVASRDLSYIGRYLAFLVWGFGILVAGIYSFQTRRDRDALDLKIRPQGWMLFNFLSWSRIPEIRINQPISQPQNVMYPPPSHKEKSTYRTE